jgi:hypothetical protein
MENPPNPDANLAEIIIVIHLYLGQKTNSSTVMIVNAPKSINKSFQFLDLLFLNYSYDRLYRRVVTS